MKKQVSIQYLRVIATLIVVLGHAIIIYDNVNWRVFISNNESQFLYYLKQYINIIQMPIFFVIAGYLFKLSINKFPSFISIFWNKFKRLIVPYIFISLCWLIPIRALIGYSNYFVDGKFDYLVIIKNFLGIDNGHLWFVYVLFIIFLIYYLANKTKTVKILFIISIFTNILNRYMHNYFFSNLVLYYLFYFGLGYLLFEKMGKIKHGDNILLLISSIILSTILIFYVDNPILSNTLSIITNLLFITFMYNYFSKFSQNKFVDFIDKNSLGIYLFHPPIMYVFFKYIPNIPPICLVTINIVVSVGISLLIMYGMRKIKINFLIGESVIKSKK